MSQIGASSVITQVTRDGKFTVGANGGASHDNSTHHYDEHAQPTRVVPAADSNKPKGWKRITQCFPSLRKKKRQSLLPPLSEEDKRKGIKTLVLDLDETLVHASFEPVTDSDFIVPVRLGKKVHEAYVRVRPGAREFLQALGEVYEIVVFTASLSKYADPVIDQLDPKGVVRYRLFRESCVHYQNNFIKDLSLLGRDLSKTIIIDNAPTSYLFHPQNALPCISWFEDTNDRELLDFIPLLLGIAKFEDVVEVLQHMNNQRTSPSGDLFKQSFVQPTDDDDV